MPSDQEVDISDLWGKSCFYPMGEEWKETPGVEGPSECHYEYFQSSAVKKSLQHRGGGGGLGGWEATYLAKAAFP